jgi:hypothetical protein
VSSFTIRPLYLSVPSGRPQRVGLDRVTPAAARSRTPVVQPIPGNGAINTAIEGFRSSVDESFEAS